LKKFTFVLVIILIIHSSIFAENYSVNILHNNQVAETIHNGIYAGTSFDIGLGLIGTLTYALGYVSKQENKNTCIYLNGTYTENVKMAYLVFQKTFHTEGRPLFWGYYLGGGYIKWEYSTISFTGTGTDEKLESFVPFIGLKFGLRFNMFSNTYLNISTEIISLKYPLSLLTISIQ